MLPLQAARLLRGPSLQIATRTYAGGHWNKDWKPGPYPQTEQERRAAAKKYGLIPEDYQPYNDDGMGFGDYPKLPVITADERDNYVAYDFDEMKRNFGEPMHAEYDMYTDDRIDGRRTRYTLLQMNCGFVGFILFAVLVAYSTSNFVVWPVKAMPKQLPADGKHYTFEIVKDEEFGASC